MSRPYIGLPLARARAGSPSRGGETPGAWLVESATLPAPTYWLTEDGGRWLTE